MKLPENVKEHNLSFETAVPTQKIEKNTSAFEISPGGINKRNHRHKN